MPRQHPSHDLADELHGRVTPPDEAPAAPHHGGTIATMAVHVDSSLPVHPLTVADIDAMVQAGILDSGDRIQLLDGVLVEMTPQGCPHAYAIRRLSALAFPVAAAAGLELSIQAPLDVGSPLSLPEPDLAIIHVTGRDERPAAALLVVEMGVTSLRLDLGRKAEIYATAGIPEYWVLDVDQRVLVVHREPLDGQYRHIRRSTEEETVHAAALDLAVPVAVLL